MKKAAGVLVWAALLTASFPAFAAEEAELRAGVASLAASASPETAALAKSLEQALMSWQQTENYHALFHKQERSDGKLGVRERIFLKFEKPFKIFLGWLNTNKKGLQVIYERGKHDGKLGIHKPGLFLGMAPVLFLDQNSPWVREGSAKYNIEDAGIGTFLLDFTHSVLHAAGKNQLAVRPLQTRRGPAFDVSFPGSVDDEVLFASRIRVFFDARTKLPWRMELFDWEGEPTGIYAYRQLQLNLKEDPAFQRAINRHLLKAYRS